jgi:DNA polymerase-3 subunit delta'
MALIPLYGHQALRERLASAARRGVLPASLLLHGPRGVGKQRLALWLGQLLLCEHGGDSPCGVCVHCRYASTLSHPDLRWYFPRERLTGSDIGPDDVHQDMAEGIAERVKLHGLYQPPSGRQAIYVATVRSLVQAAVMTPALARRKIFVVGEAERMVPQAETEQAANAFLKLLEEPPADTTIILTTSEPGALLPTIRSRVSAIRAAPLAEPEMREFAADPFVRALLGDGGTSESALRTAGGAPGTLLSMSAHEKAVSAARDLLTASGKGREAWSRAALAVGAADARGFFSDMLDALTVLLAGHQRDAVAQQHEARALAISAAIEAVEKAKERASGNANPQLLAATLVPALGRATSQ